MTGRKVFRNENIKLRTSRALVSRLSIYTHNPRESEPTTAPAEMRIGLNVLTSDASSVVEAT